MPPAPSDLAKPDRAEIFGTIVPPVLLIFAVLGAILGGIATPTEAAAVGAVGALLMAGRRLGINPRLILLGAGALVGLGILAGLFPVRLQRNDLATSEQVMGAIYTVMAIVGAIAIALALRAALRERIIHDAVDSTLTMTSMIFATILSAGFFSLVFIGLGGEERVAELLAQYAWRRHGGVALLDGICLCAGLFPGFRGNLGDCPASGRADSHPAWT